MYATECHSSYSNQITLIHNRCNKRHASDYVELSVKLMQRNGVEELKMAAIYGVMIAATRIPGFTLAISFFMKGDTAAINGVIIAAIYLSAFTLAMSYLMKGDIVEISRH